MAEYPFTDILNPLPEDAFNHSVLDWKLSERLDAALDYIHGLAVDDVANFDMEHLTAEVERFGVVPPRIRVDQCKRDEETVELVDESFDRKTGDTGHCFLIPVEGDAEWLEEMSAQLVSSDGHPLAFIDKKRNWIYIKLRLSLDDPTGTLGRKLDQRIKLAEDYASYVSNRIVRFNTELAQKMTEALNRRKAANDKARKEIERIQLPDVTNPKHVERAIQIQSLMERLNSRYLRPITYAQQLYEEVKELIETSDPLETTVARLVIEKADDALKEFGNTNQQQKLDLREWKSRAESVLAPKNLKELRDRAEATMLTSAWRRPRIRTGITALAVLVVIIGFLAYIRDLIPNAWISTGTEALQVPLGVPENQPWAVIGKHEIELDSHNKNEGSFCYRYQGAGVKLSSPDSMENPRQSRLLLLENGTPLGPKSSKHVDIVGNGRGLYSHWSDGSYTVLYFSTSDNSDPRENKRDYVLTVAKE